MGTIDYSNNGDIMEFTVRDHSRAKIETHTCPVRDKKRYRKLLEYFKEKYGFEPAIDPEDSVNAKEDKIDWWG